MRVYVLNMRGKPLMPTTPAKARHLLRDGKAKVVRREPFTIQLTYVAGEATQPIVLGVDAGSKVIGLSASTEDEELYAAEVHLRTDVSELLATRKQCRKARRSRTTRYRKMRRLNHIHSKPKGWLAPSVEQKITTHLRVIADVHKILPVCKIIIETASFDIQKIKNPEISGIEYQQGEQHGFWNVREYVLWRDRYECQYCCGRSKDSVLTVHHIQSRKTGGDAPNNLITLCETCHKKYHSGEIELPVKRGKSYCDATFMGIMRKTTLARLRAQYQAVEMTYGYLTKNSRISHNLPKGHRIDALCISGHPGAALSDVWYRQKAIRTRNRQIHKATINKGGTRKLNQAPKYVFGFQLFDKVRMPDRRVGFVFGRRSSGSFDIRTLDGTHLSAGISYKKLCRLCRRKTVLLEIAASVLHRTILAADTRQAI